MKREENSLQVRLLLWLAAPPSFVVFLLGCLVTLLHGPRKNITFLLNA